ncbi:MAG: YdcF family protein [Clostridia bacterium]|nr:YdcF family protein [Clostridia bacterium]
MKVSELKIAELSQLTPDQVDRIVFERSQSYGQTAAAAILLGGIPAVLEERAEAAAQLYHAGVVPYIIPSGGMKWDTDIGLMTEAERMNKYLKEFGVPEESILLENQATTTRENMIYATLLMEQKLKPRGNYRLYVVTSGSHLRRSMSLARLYLPRTAELIGVAGTCPTARSGQWSQDEFQAKRVYRELELIKKNIDIGDMADIEF